MWCKVQNPAGADVPLHAHAQGAGGRRAGGGRQRQRLARQPAAALAAAPARHRVPGQLRHLPEQPRTCWSALYLLHEYSLDKLHDLITRCKDVIICF